MMKIRTLFESIIQESYRDFKRIAEDAFVNLFMRNTPNATEDALRMIFAHKLNVFREGVDRNFVSPVERDIGYWIRKIRLNAEEGIYEFLQTLSDIENKIAEREPDYEVIWDDFPFKITKLNNHAAAEKLCGRMDICVRKFNDFQSYNADAYLYLIKDQIGEKFFLTQGRTNDIYDLWTKDNIEISAEEFLDYSSARVTQDVVNDIFNREPQLQYFLFDLQDAQMERDY
jgi:hypothetical protein